MYSFEHKSIDKISASIFFYIYQIQYVSFKISSFFKVEYRFKYAINLHSDGF